MDMKCCVCDDALYYLDLRDMCKDCNECYEQRFGTDVPNYRHLKELFQKELYGNTVKDSKNSKYLITFTTGTGVNVEKWVNHLNFEVNRKYVKDWKAVIEHKESNIHCHMLLETSEYVKKGKHFKTYTKVFGYVDVKLIKKDNGVDNYFQKEGTVFKKGDIIIL